MTQIETNENELKELSKEAVELAESLLVSTENYLDNIIGLSRVGRKIHNSIWDTEFHIFGVIASDTDHLPTKKVRPHCSASMLKKADQEIEGIIKHYSTEVESSCNTIISKYGNV